jgi:hypothetical protein
MAKAKGGLPAGFNLSVSSDDLVGKPVQVGGYLDEDPMLELIKAQRQARMSASAPTFAPPVAPPQAPQIQEPRREESRAPIPEVAAPQAYVPQQSTPVVPAAMNQDYVQAPAPNERKVRPPIRRLQINLTPDSERQVNELLEIISAQSAEKNIMFSEILNALILNLYEARADLNVSRVPLRGKWGAPTGKSFPIALAQAFRQAIITYGIKNGGNQFKKVVGG